MRIQDAYSHWSATYDVDRNLTRDLDGVVTRQVLGDLYMEHRAETIVELGCGTGKNTAFLAQIGRQVHAFDFSEGMIDQARTKVTASNVIFAAADITQPWPCEDRFADLLVCNLVLEHVADLEFILGEAARILVPGGRFFSSELHPFRQYAGKKAQFRHGQEMIEIGAFVHHISEFLDAGTVNGFTLDRLQEWWHEEDKVYWVPQTKLSPEEAGQENFAASKPPRLVSFLWTKA